MLEGVKTRLGLQGELTRSAMERAGESTALLVPSNRAQFVLCEASEVEVRADGRLLGSNTTLIRPK